MGAVVQEKGDGSLVCSLIDAFDDIEAAYEASRNRLLEYFRQLAGGGPQVLNPAQCHQVDAHDKIYEFIAGRLRVLFFQGSTGSVVICTDMFLKKTQKIPAKEVAKAVKAKKAYEQAVKSGLVEWRDEL